MAKFGIAEMKLQFSTTVFFLFTHIKQIITAM